MKYLSLLSAVLLAAASQSVLGQAADSYFANITFTPNAFVAGSRIDIRTDMKEFSSFFYRGVFWEASFDGVNFQSLGDAQQVGRRFIADLRFPVREYSFVHFHPPRWSRDRVLYRFGPDGHRIHHRLPNQPIETE